ncbi:MAG TPA: sirohydrochlorin chelatase [Alphaproteobacteria bacterium]|nr:sirohydrochlorin chelatase [Alphaproteobacteria bacterium]
MRKTGIMLCGHGSRDGEAIAEFEAFARALRARLADHEVEWGFLEFARPIIREGLDALVARGCDEILALPCMLFAAGHVKNDVPSVLNRYQAEHPEVSIRLGRDFGLDAKMMRAAADSVEAARARAQPGIARAETLLMVVGRGTSDPDANSWIAKVTRLLWEGLGFGWGETAYSGVTFPMVEPALEHAAKLGYRRIVVFPYFLFSGVLVKRIYAHTALVAARHPEIEFVTASYLKDHPLVIETALERLAEIERGTGNMNCQLCKYRVQLLGFEDEVALPQASHHHHVEGIGTGAQSHAHAHDHAHTHTHTHAHAHMHDPGNGHGHGHHPYPHADHPLGPKTLERLPAGTPRLETLVLDGKKPERGA